MSTFVEEQIAGNRTVSDPELGPVGLAIVGAGYWGPNLVRNALQSPTTRLTAVCDVDLARAEKLASSFVGIEAVDDLRQLLDDPTVEAVAVATPPATHLDVAMAAIEAGKHVLIEKPLASSYSDGRALVNAAEEHGVVLMCDHTYCYTPAVQRIRELVRSGVLGELHFLDSVRINLGLVQPDVDVLWDLAPHDLSILDFVLPDGVTPVAVAAHTGDPIGNGRAVATGDFVLLPSEVNPVIRALKANGIAVTALHSHLMMDQPHVLFMHFWGSDDATKLARGLRAALDATAMKPK